MDSRLRFHSPRWDSYVLPYCRRSARGRRGVQLHGDNRLRWPTRADQGCRLALFPELSLTGYSCGDLFYQALLPERAGQALRSFAEATAAPYRCSGRTADGD